MSQIMLNTVHPADRHNANPHNIAAHIASNQKECDELACDLRGMISNARDVHRGAQDIGNSNYSDRIKNVCHNPMMLSREVQALEWMLQRLVQEAAMTIKDAGLALEKCRNIRLCTDTVESLQVCMKEMQDDSRTN